MNFGKLLAQGKSIMNWRGKIAYTQNPHVYLPKFESAKNPFAKAGTPAPPPPTAPGKSPVVADKSAFVLTPAKADGRPAYTPPAPVQPTWADKLNPMMMFRGPSPAVFRNTTAVQTELSLDSVKVIENDLRDAEVEVVPLKSRPARPAKGKPGEPVEESWNDMGTKIFGANAV